MRQRVRTVPVKAFVSANSSTSAPDPSSWLPNWELGKRTISSASLNRSFSRAKLAYSALVLPHWLATFTAYTT